MVHSMTKFGSIAGHGPADLVTVASDAAVNPARGLCGIGFLSDDGKFGVLLRPLDERDGHDVVTVGELRAISYALERVGDAPRVRVLTDSRHAVRFLQGWREGGDVYPEGYGTQTRMGAAPRLVALRERVMRRAGRLDFAWVPGHEGHPLNEFADSAAKLAVRVGSREAQRSDAARLPPLWAATRLADWRGARMSA